MFRITSIFWNRSILRPILYSNHRQKMTTVAAGQFCATASMKENLENVKVLMRKAMKCGAKILFLPEASDYIARSPAQTVELARSVEESDFVIGIQSELKKLNSQLEISVGIHETTESKDKVKNTLLWIDPAGRIVHRYQKVHMFDVNIKNGPILMESRSVEPGNEVLEPFDTIIGKVGYAICYDIRFPEMAATLRRKGAQIITYPSAFTVRTGQAHWEVLGRARAIDNQCFVIMAAQVGTHDSEAKRNSWGHAMIIDPWGTVLAQCPDVDSKPRICLAEIDLTSIDRVRSGMPLEQQRRKDLFAF
ncbi:carbon-nitrogen hydrolase [Dipodascopsis uninucleata]